MIYTHDMCISRSLVLLITLLSQVSISLADEPVSGKTLPWIGSGVSTQRKKSYSYRGTELRPACGEWVSGSHDQVCARVDIYERLARVERQQQFDHQYRQVLAQKIINPLAGAPSDLAYSYGSYYVKVSSFRAEVFNRIQRELLTNSNMATINENRREYDNRAHRQFVENYSNEIVRVLGLFFSDKTQPVSIENHEYDELGDLVTFMLKARYPEPSYRAGYYPSVPKPAEMIDPTSVSHLFKPLGSGVRSTTGEHLLIGCLEFDGDNRGCNRLVFAWRTTSPESQRLFQQLAESQEKAHSSNWTFIGKVISGFDFMEATRKLYDVGRKNDQAPSRDLREALGLMHFLGENWMLESRAPEISPSAMEELKRYVGSLSR